MPRSLSHRWASAVTIGWWWIVPAWIVITIAIRLVAPSWKDVAADGDFEYLPPTMSSVAGGRLLDRAFPQERSRSQIVLVLGRQSASFQKQDEIVGLDLLRRLYHRLGEVSWQRAIDYGYETGKPVEGSEASDWLKLARESFDHSLKVDEQFYEAIAEQVPPDAPSMYEPRMAIAHWDRGKLLESLEESPEEYGNDFEAALLLMETLPQEAVPIQDRDLDAWDELIDVFSWDDPVIGRRLQNDGARLAVMRLSSELAATSNISTVEAVQTLIDDVVDYSSPYTDPGLELLMTGSAAVGGETLLAARDAIRYTEWITVAMILVILSVVYRAPILVAIPMISIGVAVLVATSLVTLLTKWSIEESVPWLDLRVFTTSRIFIVVILFGAGTDYCLFLIARLREEAGKTAWPVAVRDALSGVTAALLGSAMTTVVGLAMLWIARFGKFHYTGPIIAVCLLVGLLVCTTLTPALLRMFGPRVFWPSRVNTEPSGALRLGRTSGRNLLGPDLWSWIALWLTRRPALTLCVGLAILVMPAWYGVIHENSVTFDLTSELSPSAQSRRGSRLMAQHFEVGDLNPITVLLVRPDDLPRETLEKEIRDLTEKIYQVPGVASVRTVDDPLGDFPPDREMGILSGDAWRRRALRNHRIAHRYFFSSIPQLENRLARLDVTINGNPFSVETADVVLGLSDFLQEEIGGDGSTWNESQLLLAGTTPSIIDLRTVTLNDNRRIKIAVVVAVFAVLLIVIRRVGLCLYLIFTVLISYYATLGLTALFFESAYGADYVGLDWKLPLFLFVILVAVGQDYNVYLVTRIVEEQRYAGWVAGLRRAVSRTGGIITACGVVMAGTFLSMTASAWLPPLLEWFGIGQTSGRAALRGIVELGFALGLGVLIDTFYVRTILVPSFVACVGSKKPKS